MKNDGRSYARVLFESLQAANERLLISVERLKELYRVMRFSTKISISFESLLILIDSLDRRKMIIRQAEDPGSNPGPS